MEKSYLAALQMVTGIGNARLRALLDYFGCAKDAWEAGLDDLLISKTLGELVCANLVKFREKTDIEKLTEEWKQKDIRICTLDDPEYPALLRNIFSPPYVLYHRGKLPETDKMVAIVGSRQATSYGKNAARLFADGLSKEGVWIVSGAARGIDTAAHQGALAEGKTIAVLGSGVDVVYPPENGGLLDAIVEKGAVISEYPPGTPPHQGHFPMRNRIISGMAKGVLIIEAGVRSGALITADLALDENRDVFVLPGNVFSENSAGTNKLIKEGAKLTDSIFDILEEYNWIDNDNYKKKKANEGKKINHPKISGEERIVYDILEEENALNMEEIVVKSNLPANVVACILLQLNLNGLASELDGRRYIRSSWEGNR